MHLGSKGVFQPRQLQGEGAAGPVWKVVSLLAGGVVGQWRMPNSPLNCLPAGRKSLVPLTKWTLRKLQ